jgi:group I intron endonuclease
MKGIYKIVSPSNKVYIGQSHDIEKRQKHYTPGRCKHQRKINSSLKKYGHKNHVFEIVIVLPNDINQEVLDNYEIFVYNQFIEAGYDMLNLKDCGNGGGKHSCETKRIIGLQSKERFKSIGDYEIYQYDINLNLIKIWNDSILDICRNSNYQSPSLSRSLSKNSEGNFTLAHNYFWFYKKNLNKLREIDINRIRLKTNQYGEYYMYW